MILFLDIEYGVSTKKINEIGLVLGDQSYRGRDLSKVTDFVAEAKWICGHNLVAHDLPILRDVGFGSVLEGLEVIDTLLLCPLLKPSVARHKLTKDYQIHDLAKSDPVYDAELARDLLYDLSDLWNGLASPVQRVFISLLSQEEGFRGFFQWLDWELGSTTEVRKEHLWKEKSLLDYYAQEICSQTDLKLLSQAFPVELAYVLALVKTEDPKIVTPSWVLGNFPEIQTVFDQLRSTDCGDPNCAYCSRILNPVTALNSFFGYPGFRTFEGDKGRPLQERVVRAALEDKSLLAVFPTGGGKSLTFQLPALMRGKAKGTLTVVISPLVSLMKDQVDVLFNRFNRNEAVALNGMLSPPERMDLIERIATGSATLLYISPESLRSSTVLQLLTNRMIDRFVIDEAHCFSVWGQDFRVDYEFIGPYIRMLQDRKMDNRRIPISCFTATARPEVVEDIKSYFRKELSLELQEFITREARTNLQYQVIAVHTEEEKFENLVHILQEKPGPAIVYVTLTKRTEELAKKLNDLHISTGFFHGKMLARDKKVMQEKFMDNQFDVIVATSAFGMGVDKDNVRLVVHYEISSSLENYIQEAGRAGRDKDLEADCVILFDQTDLNQHFNILQGARISQKEIQQIWRGIQHFKRNKITKSALEIARNAGWDEDVKDLETRVRTAINALEKAGYVERFLNSPRVFADSILIHSFEDGHKIIQKNAVLFHENVEEAARVLKAIMGQSRRSGETRVDYLADSLGIEGTKLVSILNLLKEVQVLGNEKDLEVDVNLVKSKNGSIEVTRRYLDLELHLFKALGEEIEKGDRRSVSLRELNDQLSQVLPNSSMDGIRRVLQVWELHGWIKKKRTNRAEFIFEIVFRKNGKLFQQYLQKKKELCLKIVQELVQMALRDGTSNMEDKDNKTVSVEFSIILLKKKIEGADLFSAQIELSFFERALLYLNHIGAIDLKKGFLVFFNRMNIALKETNKRKQYTLEDYQKMKAQYDKRIEQIHIAGEYAKKMLSGYKEALQFTSDYFELPYEDFLKKYFPNNRRKEIRRAMTPEKFAEIFSKLSLEQQQVVRESSTAKIVVAAGPGSGKTMVLVHKMANLILLEDIHPRQLLVLAFSRPAAREFKDRLLNLVGGIARRVDIYTYHGYAFRLIGKLGNLEKSENVIAEATKAILEGDIPLEMVAAKNVIMLDEFQDVSKQEYNFLKAIWQVAGNPRIIAAGDDDQNIYEFRGSSILYMRRLSEHENTKTFYLRDNYRSGENLVEFSNAFLHYLPKSRMKSDTILKSKRTQTGSVSIIKYDRANLTEVFCRSVAQAKLKGSIGVLTATNEEAYLIASRLKHLGIPAMLVASTKEFQLKNLVELHSFTNGIFENLDSKSGRIPNETWERVWQKVRTEFSRSKDWALANRVIKTFAQEKKYKFRVDWIEYLNHANIEDFYNVEKGQVFVSTMHKIKGKEFDNVFLLLDRFQFKNEASLRVVYVAITRARDYLEIHSHLPHFDQINTPGLTHLNGKNNQEALPFFSIQCSLADVVLSHFHKNDLKARINWLRAGDSLRFVRGSNYYRAVLLEENNAMVACFSVKFKEKLDVFFEKGYRVHQLTVGHVVYWWDEKKGAKVKVVLPKVELEKSILKLD